MKLNAIPLALLLYACTADFPVSPSSPTFPPAPPSENSECRPTELRRYLHDVDGAMAELERLATAFGDSESPEQASPIVAELDNLFTDVFLWHYPKCAQEVQVNLLLAISNLQSALQAILADDAEAFQREYGTYAIAVDQLNKAISALEP